MSFQRNMEIFDYLTNHYVAKGVTHTFPIVRANYNIIIKNVLPSLRKHVQSLKKNEFTLRTKDKKTYEKVLSFAPSFSGNKVTYCKDVLNYLRTVPNLFKLHELNRLQKDVDFKIVEFGKNEIETDYKYGYGDVFKFLTTGYDLEGINLIQKKDNPFFAPIKYNIPSINLNKYLEDIKAEGDIVRLINEYERILQSFDASEDKNSEESIKHIIQLLRINQKMRMLRYDPSFLKDFTPDENGNFSQMSPMKKELFENGDKQLKMFINALPPNRRRKRNKNLGVKIMGKGEDDISEKEHEENLIAREAELAEREAEFEEREANPGFGQRDFKERKSPAENKIERIEERFMQDKINDDEAYDIENLSGVAFVNPSAHSFLKYIFGSKDISEKAMKIIEGQHYGRINEKQTPIGSEGHIDISTGVWSSKPTDKTQESRVNKVLLMKNKLTEMRNKDSLSNTERKMKNLFEKITERYDTENEILETKNRLQPGKFEIILNRLMEASVVPKKRFGTLDCPPDGRPKMTEQMVLPNGFSICYDPNKHENVRSLFGNIVLQEGVSQKEIERIQDIAKLFTNVDEMYRENINELLGAIRARDVKKNLKQIALSRQNPIVDKIVVKIEQDPEYLRYMTAGIELGLSTHFPDYFPKSQNFADRLRFYYGPTGPKDFIDAVKRDPTTISGSGMDGKIPMRPINAKYYL